MSAPEAEPKVPAPEPEQAPDPAADLPPLDSIGAETDLAPWLRPGIPAALKNAALRRKWLSTPAIRDYVDPALDYAWDWNAAAGVPGAAGRIAAEAAAKMLKSLTAAPEAPDGAAPDAPVPATAEPAPVVASAAPRAESSAAAQGSSAPPAPEPRPAPRRHGGARPRPPSGSPDPST